ncbi:DUF6481 family protein [Rhizosaccharibacter radicis]|uniref:DUF6481 family protein n=1 Tax=Rhizosaccharibacter radicis TaxID=2782605 RepID=A0ABT1VXR0_9PROT|nr:DUF6481 family protein [Acetobacteraceae bacterium KSS12]
MLAKFQTRPAADDPEVKARAEERRRVAEARDARIAERRAAKAAEAARLAAEKEAARLAAEVRRREEEAAAAELARQETIKKLKLKFDTENSRYPARKAKR